MLTNPYAQSRPSALQFWYDLLLKKKRQQGPPSPYLQGIKPARGGIDQPQYLPIQPPMRLQMPGTFPDQQYNPHSYPDGGWYNPARKPAKPFKTI